jgi:hypothetical protein
VTRVTPAVLDGSGRVDRTTTLTGGRTISRVSRPGCHLEVIERSGTQPTSNSGDDGTGIEPFDGGANMKTRLFVALSSLATLVLVSGASVAWR